LPPLFGGKAAFMVGQKIETLDPAQRLTEAERQVSLLAYETLFVLRDGRAIDWLSSKHRFENGDRDLHVWLKPDIILHDGSTMQTAHVRKSFEYVLKASSGTTGQELLLPIKGANKLVSGEGDELSGFEIVSDYEFVLHLEKADSGFDRALCEVQTSITGRKRRIGSGTYKIENISPKGVRLALNDRHHKGRAYLDRLEFAYASGVAEERRKLDRGAYSGTFSGRILKSRKGRAFIAPGTAAVMLDFNPRRKSDSALWNELLRSAFDCRQAVRLFEPRRHAPFEGDVKKPSFAGVKAPGANERGLLELSEMLIGRSCKGFEINEGKARGLAESLPEKSLRLLVRKSDAALDLIAQRMALMLEPYGVKVEVLSLGASGYKSKLASGDYEAELYVSSALQKTGGRKELEVYRVFRGGLISDENLKGIGFDALGFFRLEDLWEAAK